MTYVFGAALAHPLVLMLCGFGGLLFLGETVARKSALSVSEQGLLIESTDRKLLIEWRFVNFIGTKEEVFNEETTTYFGVGVTDEGRNVIDAIPNGKAGVDFCFPDLGYNEGALAAELNRYAYGIRQLDSKEPRLDPNSTGDAGDEG